MDLDSASLTALSSYSTDTANVTMTPPSLSNAGVTLDSSSDVDETVHGCLVLALKSNASSQATVVERLVSEQAKQWAAIISFAGIVLLFLVGVPGNILSAAVFYRQGLRERINLCVFCLALVDLVVLTVTFFLAGEEVYNILIGSMYFFKKNFLALTGFIRVSMFLSAVIAAERCFCVVSPLRAQRMLSTRTLAIAIASVSLILVTGLAVITGTKRTEVCVFDPRKSSTSFRLQFTTFYKENKDLMDTFGTIVYGTAIPVVFFVFIMVTTAITVIELRSAVTWRQQSSSSRVQTTRGFDHHMVALTRMLIATSVVFVVCLSPILIVQMTAFAMPELRPGGRYSNLRNVLWKSINVFRCINSSLNFFVYYRMGARFRQCLKELLCCQKVNVNLSVSGSVVTVKN
ncbi:uncharacterized protein LOC143281363 [Babylonia areolata]|uniref:uncharacterized protein LOC143281363 n=1 Tax=Babylonia areolata TaxID=304850 RepID=UPI003FD458B1